MQDFCPYTVHYSLKWYLWHWSCGIRINGIVGKWNLNKVYLMFLCLCYVSYISIFFFSYIQCLTCVYKFSSNKIMHMYWHFVDVVYQNNAYLASTWPVYGLALLGSSIMAWRYRADSRCVPSQWEMALLCNDVSHWLGASLESALRYLLMQETVCILHHYAAMNYLDYHLDIFVWFKIRQLKNLFIMFYDIC